MSKPDEATRLRRQMHEQRVTLRSQTKQIERLRAENTELRRALRAYVAQNAVTATEVATCGLTGLRCVAGCDGRNCAGLHIPLNQWPNTDDA